MTKYPIFSFDTLPMQNPESTEMHYSGALLFEDGAEKTWNDISRNYLIKLVHKYKPSYFGTDNPHEILMIGESVATFCKRLPTQTQFVHVNLTIHGNSLPLRKLMRLNGIETKAKPNPLQTAKIINTLIEKGNGMILEPFEDETIIHIGKVKNHKKGGWSQARFSRQNEEVVYRVSEQIHEKLKENNFQFDLHEVRTKSGAKWRRFYVFETKVKVEKILSKVQFSPAKVKLWRPKKSIISHKPLNPDQKIDFVPNSAKYLIVGIDPGMETGCAIIDLNGKYITGFSKKGLSRGDILAAINKYGSPLVVATDVNPTPFLVKKIATNYHAVLWSPNRTLSQDEKKQIVLECINQVGRNSHIRDSLAAALFAWRRYRSYFDQIDIIKHLSPAQRTQAKYLFVQGFSIKDCIKQVSGTEKAESQSIPDNKITISDQTQALQNHVKNLERDNSFLIAENERLKRQNNNLQKQLQKSKDHLQRMKRKEEYQILSQTIMQEKDRVIGKLEEYLEMLKQEMKRESERVRTLEDLLWRSMESGGLPIKVLSVFSIDAIEQLRRKQGINHDDILLIKDPTGGGMRTIKQLMGIKLKMIFFKGSDFAPDVKRIFYEKNIPNINGSKYGIIEFEGTALISRQNLELAIHDYQMAYARDEENRKWKGIEKTIENYYHERSKELKDLTIDYSEFEE